MITSKSSGSTLFYWERTSLLDRIGAILLRPRAVHDPVLDAYPGAAPGRTASYERELVVGPEAGEDRDL